MQRRLTALTLAGLVLGVVCGLLLHMSRPQGIAPDTARLIALPSVVFLRLIKMVVGPLVFATLTSGIAGAGSGKAVARIGSKAILWFLGASIASLAIGASTAMLLAPGLYLHLMPAVSEHTAVIPSHLDAIDAITNVFPTSFFDALASNNILQIVVFALFAGGALLALGDRAALLARAVSQLAALMLTITRFLMLASPLAVLSAIAGVVAKQGVGVFAGFAALLADFYLALGILVGLFVLVAWSIVRGRLPDFLRAIREPTILSFATSSSEAAYPRLLAGVEAFGVPNRIASLVLPLGYSFNLDASLMYCAFGSLFIAQAYGIPLTTGQIASMMAMLMLASKGIAAVPRGALVAIAATIPHFGLPDEGVVLLLGIDHLMNMGRSATNVLGNALAIVGVARWEDNLDFAPRPLADQLD